jgi:hypothetical protein
MSISGQASSRLGVNTVITMSLTSIATAAFGAQTYQIRVATSAQPAFIKIFDATGPASTASTSDVLIPANCWDYFTVTPGQKLAVVQAGSQGSISITEQS